MRRLAFVLVLTTVLLTGCGRTSDTLAVDERLAELSKFDSNPFTAEHRADGGLTLHTSVVPRVNEQATESDYTDIARIVWNTYRPLFDRLEISAKGAPTTRTFTYADLLEKFGSPVHTMNPEDYPGDTETTLLFGAQIAGFVVFALLLVAIIRYYNRKQLKEG